MVLEENFIPDNAGEEKVISPPKISEITSGYAQSIRDRLPPIENDTALLELDLTNTAVLASLSQTFENITETAVFMEEDPIRMVAGLTTILLNEYLQANKPIKPPVVILIKRSTGYIERLLDNSSLVHEPDFFIEINEHLEELRKYRLVQIEINLPKTNFLYFTQVMREYLKTLEEMLIRWGKNPSDQILPIELFKTVDQMMETSVTMSLMKISGLVQEIKEVLQDIKEQDLKVTSKLIQLLLIGGAYLESSLGKVLETGDETQVTDDNLMGKVHRLIEDRRRWSTVTHGQSGKKVMFSIENIIGFKNQAFRFFEPHGMEVDREISPGLVARYHSGITTIERNIPEPEVLSTNSEAVDDLLREFRLLKTMGVFLEQGLISKIAGETELLLDEFREGTVEADPSGVGLVQTSLKLLKRLGVDVSLNRDLNFISTVNEHLDNIRKRRTVCFDSSEKTAFFPFG